jgi:hypothetical protein
MMPTVAVTRYVTPLREGGSLPGLVEADDLGTYVCKFRGAGQGLRVLVAEVIAAGIALALDVPTPRLVVLDLDPAIARYEADEEVQDLLTASAGHNLGIDFLPGSFGFDGTVPGEGDGDDHGVAARILWLDAFLANVDRTWRNPNLLIWGDRLWAIDHGASLYFHHSWAGGLGDPQRFAGQPWDVTGHVFADRVDAVRDLDSELRTALGPEALAGIVADVPEEWLAQVPGATTDQQRAAYVEFLLARLASEAWLPVRGAA